MPLGEGREQGERTIWDTGAQERLKAEGKDPQMVILKVNIKDMFSSLFF